MTKHTYKDIIIREPSILDNYYVLEMRKEFLTTNCKFNGTCDLDKYEEYITWLAHTLHQTHSSSFNNEINCTKHCYLVTDSNNILLGMIEIIFYTNKHTMRPHAHIIECIRPSQRRKGYGKPLLKKAIHECHSYGIKKEDVSFERNSKASNDTMNKILDF